jgi:hypothetical protein
VTRNCGLALGYLRKTDSTWVLWIDAICINQEDDKERGHQVAIMRDVYSRAIEVLIWLGEARKIAAFQIPGSDYELFNPRNTSEDTVSVTKLFLEFLGRMAAEITQI